MADETPAPPPAPPEPRMVALVGFNTPDVEGGKGELRFEPGDDVPTTVARRLPAGIVEAAS